MAIIANQLFGFRIKYVYEVVADYLAFLFGIGNPGELGKKLGAGSSEGVTP